VKTTLDITTALVLEEEPPSFPWQLDAGNQKKTAAPKANNVFFSNIVWMLVGNVAYGFSQWTLLVALAKLGTMEMVGNFALAIAVVLPVLMFSSLSLRSLQATDVHRAYRFLEYGALRLVTVVLSFLFIVVFGLVSGYSASLLAATALIGAAKGMEYISDILYGLLQQEEDMAGISISMLLRSVFSVVALSITVYLTHSLVWAAGSLVVCSAAVLFGYDIPKAVSDRKGHLATEIRTSARYLLVLTQRFHRQRLWKLALTGLPMGFALMMVSLNLNIPRYFIREYLGMAELGIFSAIATLLASGSVVINAIGQAAAPRMANAFANQDKRRFRLLLAGLVTASLGFGGLGWVGAALFGKQGMALIYRPEYSTRQEVLVWLMAASGLYYLGSTLGYAVTAVRCFTPQLPLFVVAAASAALGCFLFVPRLGLRGAALAILLSACVQCIGSVLLLWRASRKANVLAVAKA